MKLSPVALASHMDLAGVLAAPLLIQVPADMPRKATEDSPNTWASVAHEGDKDGVPGFGRAQPQ